MTADAIQTSSSGGPQTRDSLTHRQLLGSRLYVQTWVRLAVAGAIAVLAQWSPAGLLDPRAIAVLPWLAVGVAGYDLGAWLLSRRCRAPLRSADAHRALQATMHATVALDYLALTVFVWVTGGSASPLLPFYVIHAVVSQLLLSRWRGLSCALLALASIVAVVVCDQLQVLPRFAAMAGPAAPRPQGPLGAVVLIVANGVPLLLAAAFVQDLSLRLREHEGLLHVAVGAAQRLSELRKDFLRITTHNLNAPVGAMAMQLENLETGLLGPVSEPQREVLKRCRSRLREMSAFVRDLHTLAMLDDREMVARQVLLDLGPVLTGLVEEYQDVAAAKGVQLSAELPPELPCVRGIERLLHEAIVNFVTNAIKYTPRGGHVHVRAEHHGEVLRVVVQDDGIGIAPEDQARLFQEFVRLGKQDPKSGSGLGLSIARRVAEAHGGCSKVWSEPGVGSIFSIELPVAKPRASVG